LFQPCPRYQITPTRLDQFTLRLGVLCGTNRKPHLHKLPGVKVIVATIDYSGHCPIFEIKVCGVAAGDAPARVPDVGATAQAAHHAAGDRSDEIEVVRSLAPQDAAAEFLCQLFGGPRAVEPVVETPAVDHAEPAEFTGAHHLAQAQHAWLEAMFDVDA